MDPHPDAFSLQDCSGSVVFFFLCWITSASVTVGTLLPNCIFFLHTSLKESREDHLSQVVPNFLSLVVNSRRFMMMVFRN